MFNQKLVLFVLGLEEHQMKGRKLYLGASSPADFLIRLSLLIDWLIYREPVYTALGRKWGYSEGWLSDQGSRNINISLRFRGGILKGQNEGLAPSEERSAVRTKARHVFQDGRN